MKFKEYPAVVPNTHMYELDSHPEGSGDTSVSVYMKLQNSTWNSFNQIYKFYSHVLDFYIPNLF